MLSYAGHSLHERLSALAALAGLAAACLAALPCAHAGGIEGEDERREVRIGIVDSAEPGFFASTVRPTAEAVESALPNTRVALVRLSPVTLLNDIEHKRTDLFIAPAADFLRIVDARGAHPIATRKSASAVNPAMSAGGAFVVRSDRTDLQTLSNLKGKRAAATLPTALDGWLAARIALEDAGWDSKDFFAKVHFLGFGMPDVVSSVLSGSVDAGILPACMLEHAEAKGLIEKGALRVIGAVEDDLLACRHSTPLYPDWVAATLPGADPALTRDLTIALLSASMKTSEAEAPFAWLVTSDFHAVRELERRLHLGQWSYLDSWSPEALWRRFRWYALGLALVLLAGALNERRLRTLVRRRTAELQAALDERDRLEEAERKARARLSELERMGAISQLCAMIAHELKQPVGAVINYMAVLQMRLGRTFDDAQHSADPLLVRALEGAGHEARRIASIVDRVRAYARREKRPSEPVDLAEAVRAAAGGVRPSPRCSLQLENLPPASVPSDAVVMGDRLELELLFLNLIKNAVEAAESGAQNPEVHVRLERASSDAQVRAPDQGSSGRIVVRITDNGPRLSDEAFSRLMTASESVKAEGLGLGLAIVRNIVDEHGATLAIRRRAGDGLDVSVAFERAAPDTKETSP